MLASMAPNLGAILDKNKASYSNVFRFRNIDLNDYYVRTIKKPKIRVMNLSKNFFEDSENVTKKDRETLFEFKQIQIGDY